MDIFLSIIIPALNEELRLQKTLPVLKSYLGQKNYTWEVILVDDGSTDGASRILETVFTDQEARVIRNPVNRGKGYSVRRGVKEARGEIILLSDADFSTPIYEFEKLYSCLEEGYDITIGSRSLPHSKVTRRQAWHRENMGRTFNLMVRWFVLEGIIDTQCGFKCFSRKLALPIFEKMTVDHFAFDVEFLFIAAKRGLRIKELPVEWENSPQSRVGIILDPIRMALDLIRIRINYWMGRYD